MKKLNKPLLKTGTILRPKGGGDQLIVITATKSIIWSCGSIIWCYNIKSLKSNITSKMSENELKDMYEIYSDHSAANVLYDMSSK